MVAVKKGTPGQFDVYDSFMWKRSNEAMLRDWTWNPAELFGHVAEKRMNFHDDDYFIFE